MPRFGTQAVCMVAVASDDNAATRRLLLGRRVCEHPAAVCGGSMPGRAP